MLDHLYPSKWPSRFARFTLFLSELLFVWVVIKFIFVLDKGSLVPYWLAFEDNLSLPLLLVSWGGISASFMIRLIWKYHIGWLMGSIFCAFCATFVLFGLNAWGQIDTAQFNGQTFYLASSIDGRGWAGYLLCGSDKNGNVINCREVYAATPPFPAKFVIDPLAGKLSVMVFGSKYHQSDVIVYTLDLLGNQWCLNQSFCKPLSRE